jgi:hypothetical protein
MRRTEKVEGTEIERLKSISINAARELGQAAHARRIVILALSGTDYSVTTWGRTRAECGALARWAESQKAMAALRTIADAKPDSGIITVANEPGVISDFGVGGCAPILQQIDFERQRQVASEGWTAAHDDGHSSGELALAAACYAVAATNHPDRPLATAALWPSERKWFKPSFARSNLIKAAALILAEIERLDRMEQMNAREIFPAGITQESEYDT